tara:strand:+ start:548 stop:1609 length:1062 start_codon:yes stop_codon:yes gene_type:complete
MEHFTINSPKSDRIPYAGKRNVRSIVVGKNKSKKLNILTFATHERYEESLCNTGHNFYSLTSGKQWDTAYARVPENYHIIDKLPNYVDFDLVLSHTSCNRIQLAHDLLSESHGGHNAITIPILRHCHVLPDVRHDVDRQKHMFQNMPYVNSSFISKYNRDQWGFNETNSCVVPHGVDTNFWKPVENSLATTHNYALSAVNEFPTRDWCCGYNLWTSISKKVPCLVVGKCTTHPNFSESAKNTEDLRDHYNKAAFYLNTSLHSPVPTALMEAMACGLPVVSTNNCMIPEIIQHGVNGFMSNDPLELEEYCRRLLVDQHMAHEMGLAARETIVSKFGMSQFVDNWNQLLYKVIGE